MEKKNKEWLAPSDFFADPFSAFKNFFPTRFGSDFSFPEIDMIDEGDSIRIKADMPGVDKQDIKLKVTSNAVTISAANKEEKEKKDKNYYYSERSARQYYRSIPIPVEVDSKSAKATFKNGMLEVSLKKKATHGEEIKIE
ncbi:MAG: Hsp20/alpha crystallin family protein [Candidatus Micrarchaeia archaeon]